MGVSGKEVILSLIKNKTYKIKCLKTFQSFSSAFVNIILLGYAKSRKGES